MTTTKEKMADAVGRLETVKSTLKAMDGIEATADQRKKVSDEVTALVKTVSELRASAKTESDLAKIDSDLNALTEPPAGANNKDGLGSAPAANTKAAMDKMAGSSGVVNPVGGMTVGEAFVKSPAYLEFVEKNANAQGMLRDGTLGSVSLPVTGTLSGTMKSFDLAKGEDGKNVKNLITGTSDTSPFNRNLGGTDRMPGLGYVPVARRSIRDLCSTIVATSGDSFEFVRTTGTVSNAAPVAEATTAADIEAGVVTAIQAGQKPESDFNYEIVEDTYKTLAHYIHTTRRSVSDWSQLMSEINAFLMDGLVVSENSQILTGDGTGQNFTGILNTPGILTQSGAGNTDLDAIVLGAAQIWAQNRKPNLMVVNPTDWFSTGLLLAKDGNLNYQIGSPSTSIEAVQALWDMQVIVDNAQPAGSILVGDFSRARFVDREQAQLYVTDSHASLFTRNILTILAEMRVGLGVMDPQAFCVVTPA